MSKKTVKRHYKKHKHKNKRTYRKKRFNRINNGTGKGVKLFTEPENLHSESILVNQNQIQSGNMIPGLREM